MPVSKYAKKQPSRREYYYEDEEEPCGGSQPHRARKRTRLAYGRIGAEHGHTSRKRRKGHERTVL